jgi:hypothetical protein
MTTYLYTRLEVSYVQILGMEFCKHKFRDDDLITLTVLKVD